MSPKIGETVGVYLEVTVTSVLFMDYSENPVYFISRKLIGRETNYTKLEKMAFGLVYTTKKLQHYF